MAKQDIIADFLSKVGRDYPGLNKKVKEYVPIVKPEELIEDDGPPELAPFQATGPLPMPEIAHPAPSVIGGYTSPSITKTTDLFKTIYIRYFSEDIPRLSKIDKGDWIDLHAAETVVIKRFEHKLIPLGISMALPKGYEAIVAPRSSTFKNWGILMTNGGPAIIDNSYKGTGDQWYFSAWATRIKSVTIEKGSKIAQFRIIENMPAIQFIETDKLDDIDRGGFGSTGTT